MESRGFLEGWRLRAPGRGIALCALAALLLPGLLLRHCWPLDELRYLEVVREMWESGDLLVLRLRGEPYTHKLPLVFWEVGVLGRLIGLDLAARLVPALHAVLFVLGCASFVRELTGSPHLGRRAALLAALSPGVLYLGQMFYFDMPLAAALVWMLALRRRRPLSAALLLGIALFTKGPVALLLGLPPWIALAIRDSGPRALLPSPRLLGGILCAFMPLGVWLLLLRERLGPADFELLVFGQTGGRLSGSLGHRKPFWFYVPVAILFTLPWFAWGRSPGPGRGPESSSGEAGPPLPAQNGLLGDPALLSLCCGLLQVLVFSAIPTKAPHYVFPLLPLALPWAVTRLGAAERAGAHHALRILAGFGTLCAIGLASGLAAALLEGAPPRLAVLAADLAALPPVLPLASIPLLLAAAVPRPRRLPFAVRWTLALAGLSLLLLPPVDRFQRPTRSLQALRAHQREGRPLHLLRPLFHGNLHYLLGRTRLPVVETPDEIRRAFRSKGAWVVGFAKHEDFLPADLDLEVVLEDSFFTRPFRIWRLKTP